MRKLIGLTFLGMLLGVTGVARADDPFPVGPPNDTYYQQYQWALRQVDLPSAWTHTTGSPSVTIAVLDTGVVSTTPDLSGRILPALSAVPGQLPFSDATLASTAALRHGTNVASVAAMGINNGIGGAGVGNFSILPIRVTTNTGTNSTDWLIAGIQLAVQNGAKIINISSTTLDYAGLDQAAHDVAGQALVFVAAGNTDGLVNRPAYDDLIFVSGTDANDNRWSDGSGNGSSYGPFVDLAAPAADPMLVADPSSPSGYGRGSGTSFATPLVSGIAGLVWSINPALTPAEVRTILFNTADDLGTPGWDETFGYGRVDAGTAVEAALATVPEPQTMLLMALGACGLFAARRTRNKRLR